MEQAFELVPASGAKEVAIGLRRALALLLQGYDYGQELGRPVWEFAVEIAELKAAGGQSGIDPGGVSGRGVVGED